MSTDLQPAPFVANEHTGAKVDCAEDGTARAQPTAPAASTTKTASTQRPLKKRVQKRAPVIKSVPKSIGELTSTGAPIWVKDACGTEFPLYWTQIRILRDHDAGSLEYRVEGRMLVGPAK